MNTLNKEDIKQVVFSEKEILLYTKDNKTYKQNLIYYPRLLKATEEEKAEFELSLLGLHWKNLQTDVSFESFFYDFSKEFCVSKTC